MLISHSLKQHSPCPLLICPEENLDIIVNLLYSSQSLEKILNQLKKEKKKKEHCLKAVTSHSNLQHSILPISIPYSYSLQVCVASAAFKIQAPLHHLSFHLKSLKSLFSPIASHLSSTQRKKKINSSKDAVLTCILCSMCVFYIYQLTLWGDVEDITMHGNDF